MSIITTPWERVDRAVLGSLRRWSVPLLRYSLAVVFVWFGALKVLGVTPVSDLVASTVYWLDPDLVVPLLGVGEIAIGLGLAMRVLMRLVVAVLLAQLAGTFLVLIVLPGLAFEASNPLLLTVEGEFVIKNLVLISAGLVVGSFVGSPTERVDPVDEPS